MADTAIVSNATINGRLYRRAESRTDDGLVEKAPPDVAAAKTGALATRTNNTDGTLTMDPGHGITTGARIDLYWSGGSRRGVTVGTVSGNSVPISSGAGDNLPAASTAVAAAVAREEVFPLTGDNAVVVGVYSAARGTVVFADGSNTELYHRVLPAAGGWWWDANGDASNPLAGAAVAKVFFTHADTVNQREMRAVAVFP